MSDVLIKFKEFELIRIISFRDFGKKLMLFARYEILKNGERVSGYCGGNDEKAIKWFQSELKNRYNLTFTPLVQ